MSYTLLKSLHLLGVTLFLGNLVVTALWKTLADRTGQPPLIAFSQRLVTVTDWVFTAPGAALILVSGQLMAGGHAGIFAHGWLTLGWGLFMAAGAIWALVLLPVQWRQARLTRAYAQAAALPPAYWRLARVWAVAGLAATVLPLANLYVMVVKPG